MSVATAQRLPTAGRLLRSARAISRELRGVSRTAADLRSFGRCGADVVLYRALSFGDLPGAERERRVHMRGGVTVSYRLNRGDIQGMREVLVQETYRPPVPLGDVRTIVDLGANIGLTSVYLAKRYPGARLIALEPASENAALTRANLAANGVDGEVIEAAIGSHDGTARFSTDRDSNLGRVGGDGIEVAMMTMASVLERLPAGQHIDLLKMDIEGGEEDLLDGDRAWLRRVGCIMAEFHPKVVDYPRLVQLLQDEGFRYIPAGSVYAYSADTFVRPPGV